MKRTIVALMALSGLLASANANLITNGDFEADGLANTANNIVGPITGWNDGANVRVDTVDSKLPAVPTTAVRLTGNATVYQNFTTAWDADSTFTVDFNACNVWWKSGTEPGIWVSLRSATGTEYEAQLANTAQTHTNSTYADWTEDMTWSFDFSGADLIAAGASADDELRVNFYSKNNSNSISWLDNVSVTVIPEPATLGLVAAFGGSVLFIRRRFMI
ncbi:hypothetical protein [Pontiella sp.]|uniref:hypothetical protein n=1 Tax=Pontiella sp. TaxID=2837462 RepID=UPI0035640CBF